MTNGLKESVEHSTQGGKCGVRRCLTGGTPGRIRTYGLLLRSTGERFMREGTPKPLDVGGSLAGSSLSRSGNSQRQSPYSLTVCRAVVISSKPRFRLVSGRFRKKAIGQ